MPWSSGPEFLKCESSLDSRSYSLEWGPKKVSYIKTKTYKNPGTKGYIELNNDPTFR
jgi:hypothetical protein